MSETLLIAFGIIILAFAAQYINSSIGMGYGTLLSPLLIIFGFSPILTVPSILITQAFGGLSASIFHHKYGHVKFGYNSFNIREIKKRGIAGFLRKTLSQDLKVVVLITSLGILATTIAAFIAVNLPRAFVSAYIAVLVLTMGVLIISGITFKYSFRKMLAVGVISSFNKGISGGGFGPVVTGGQMVLGQDHKRAIGRTIASEVPICAFGFLVYFLSSAITDWSLIAYLGTGAAMAGIFGPKMTKKMEIKKMRIAVSFAMMLLGIIALAKVLGFISLKISV